ncbi:MAG: AAA family ATPase [Saprospiraceae bacterium]|nr:AAA family ATPase [Saprospiraceae bacterium]
MQFANLRFTSGGNFLVPLSDQQALQIHEDLQPMVQRYAYALQQHVNQHGRLEDLLIEQVPGPLLRQKLTLDFPASTNKIQYPAFEIEFEVVFNKGPNQYWGLIPALGIESVAKTEEKLLDRLKEAIRAHLNRKRHLNLLEKAISSIWFEHIELLEEDTAIQSPYPWEWGMEANRHQAGWLIRVAQAVLMSEKQQAFGRDKELKQLQRATSNPYNRSCILIGPSGSGKSTLVYELARKQKDFLPIIWETTAARLIKELTNERGWQDNISFLLQELQRLGIFLYVRQLKELFEIGQYEGNNISIAEFLIPSINRGELAIISECTPEDQVWIERKSPGFFNSIQTIILGPLTENLGDVIFKKIAQDFEEDKLNIFPEGIEEAIDLHRRFFPYAGEPGQSIRFLENLLRDEKGRDPNLNRKEVVHYFSKQSGIPVSMIDPQEPFDPKAIRQVFSDQVFGQEQAVDGLADMLGAVKNQLIRTDKPIASFLFIGPTGVGKTELSKVLAEFMFGDRNKMERFDMSEYASPAAVFRLTSQGGGLLTSTIRRNPFCVLLFDEVEKAHPDFFDLLLQILGEGRLTGSDGQAVNFCSTIIIMTSNIGATAAQTAAISLQKSKHKVELRGHFLRAVQKHFRPELFNRIDRIIPFDPLSPEIMRQVVDREIKLLRTREGISHRRIDLDIQSDVRDYLAKTGYDSKMGARHLQRCLREQLVIPLARALNAASADEHLQVSASLENGKPQIRLEIDPLNVELWLEEYEKVSLVEYISQQRRDLQAARQSNLYIQFLSELDILKRQKSRDEDQFWKNPEKARNYAAFLEESEKLDMLQTEIDSLEEEISLASFGLTPYMPEIAQRVEDWKKAFLEVRSTIYRALNPGHDQIYFGIYGRQPAVIVDFYESLFSALGFEVEAHLLVLKNDQQSELEQIAITSDWYENPDLAVYGWEAKITGSGAAMVLAEEEGLLSIIDEKGEESRFLVKNNSTAISPPEGILRKETYGNKNPRRVLKPGHILDNKISLNREFGKEGPVPWLLLELNEGFELQMDEAWQV